MIYFNAFLCAGIACFIGQIILDNTKLTPGHLTSIYTVLGAVLAFFGIYSKLIDCCGAGATILISNFGNMLYLGAVEGFHEQGIFGFFGGLLTKSSGAIVGAVIFAFVFALIFKPRD